jgi:hypothetical protein
MTRKRIAQVITIAVLAVALGAAVLRGRGSPAPQSPQQIIYSMIDAAGNGDVQKYSAHFLGTAASALQQSIRDLGEQRFSQSLRESNFGLKGVAIAEPEVIGEKQLKTKVEYVFQDRNEVQVLHLENSGGSWKIARMDSAERIKTPIQYGTPVE